MQIPNKFFREEFNKESTARNYNLTGYLSDPSIYDMTTYTYEPGKTHIMTQKDFCRFLGLSYLRLRMVQDFADGHLAKRAAAAMETCVSHVLAHGIPAEAKVPEEGKGPQAPISLSKPENKGLSSEAMAPKLLLNFVLWSCTGSHQQTSGPNPKPYKP